jgi:hypothetical protein
MSQATSGRPSARATVESAFIAPDLALLREKAPEIYQEFIKAKQNEWRHLRRLAWADVIAQIIGHLSGLVALAILAVISWHAIDRNDAAEGASIICTGAVSIVAVFVTGRLTSRGTRKKSDRNSAAK